MPRARLAATVRGMVRMVLAFAVLGVAFVILRERVVSDGGGAAPVQSAVDTSRVPKEFRSLLAYRPDPAAILASRGALPGLGVIRRLAGHDADRPATDEVRPFGNVGSRRDVREVQRHIRRDIEALNRLSEMDDVTPAEAERTLELVYSAATLDSLGPDGRQAFAARVAGATHASQKIKLLEFDGVFV